MATTGVFRHRAGFGKRMEYFVIGLMLRDGLDVYVPLVDDHAVDAIIKRADGSIAQVQIKARSTDVKMGDAGLFAGIAHDEVRPDYWYVFYSQRLDRIFLMTAAEFLAHANQNKSGKNAGKWSIWFNGKRKGKTGTYSEHVHTRFKEYEVTSFERLASIDPQ